MRKASSLSDGLTRPTTGFNLDALCDRVALEKDWVNQTGQPKPRLEYQGSDSFLKKQFRYCAKGEIGYFAPKHIISALPEEGERPTKSHRKFTMDGFEKEEEEEERANPQTAHAYGLSEQPPDVHTGFSSISTVRYHQVRLG